MKTILKCSLYDYKTKTGYDISKNVQNLEMTTHIKDEPGKATFNIVKSDGPINFNEGAGVEIRLNGFGLFKGFVFEKTITQEKYMMKVVCYDQLRYLKNKDAKVFVGLTSDKIFSQICDEYVLKYKVVDKSNYVCTPRSNDDVTLYEMIQRALDDTLIHTGEWYVIIDNFGTLQHVNVYSLQPQILIGDSEGLVEFNYKTDIDTQTYDQIALYKDDTESGKRKVIVVNDTMNGGNNLLNWGVLQLYEKVDENVTDAQMKQKALKLLDLYNHPTRTLSLTAYGNVKVRAGSILQVNIRKMANMNINNEVVLVTDCTHKIDNNVHTMKLSVQVMQK